MSENSSSPAASSAPEAATTQPAEGSAPVQPTQAEIRKMKLKIDGVEGEYGEDEVVRWAQQGKSSSKRFEEASKMKRESEQLIDLIKRDPRAVLSDPRIGVDVIKFAEELLVDHLKQEMMSPEQKKYAQMEKDMRKYQEAEKEQKTQQEQSQMTQLQTHYANEYTKTITDALSQGGVPKTSSTVKRMAKLLSDNIQHGFDLKPADLAKLVKEDYLAEMKELLGSSDGDTLLALLGEGTANKIRQSDLKRLRGTNQPSQKQATSTKRAEPTPQNRNIDDFFEDLKRNSK